MGTTQFSLNDKVTYFGTLIGRVLYVRQDEYRADMLYRAK